MDDERHRILLAATGSVASIKIPLLIKALLKSPIAEIKLIVTERAKHFFNVKDLPSKVAVYDDELEWSSWKGRGDPVIHIELTKWADIMLVAPLDANCLAKISQGICDNLVTCAARAWETKKPLFFCPAMNTQMWLHPVTAQQIDVLKSWGYTMIPPISKILMCGDTGVGAMEEVDKIVAEVMIRMVWQY